MFVQAGLDWFLSVWPYSDRALFTLSFLLSHHLVWYPGMLFLTIVSLFIFLFILKQSNCLFLNHLKIYNCNFFPQYKIQKGKWPAAELVTFLTRFFFLFFFILFCIS